MAPPDPGPGPRDLARVQALTEALPYVQRWSGRTVVVKYGGAAQQSEALAEAVMGDVALLVQVGVRVVLCHGGGPAVSAMGERLGLQARFVDGLRITDDETMRVAQQVQVGLISRDIVAALGRHNVRAVGLSGHDGAGWLRATPRKHTSRETGLTVDLGRVGDVGRVKPGIIHGLLENGFVPVVAPVAVDDALASLNVNADSVAAAVAGAIGAARVVFLTDVEGIRGPTGDAPARVDRATLVRWIDEGAVTGGMLPKVQACLDALDAGADGATVADGRVPHALLLELLTDRGVGTLVQPEPAP